MKENPIQTIGDRIDAKYKTFFDENFRQIHQAWVPLVEVDGRLLPLYDPSTISGQMEAPSRKEALFLARCMRERLKARLRQHS